MLLSVLRVHGFGAYAVGDVVHGQNPTLVKQTGGGGDNGLSGHRDPGHRPRWGPRYLGERQQGGAATSLPQPGTSGPRITRSRSNVELDKDGVYGCCCPCGVHGFGAYAVGDVVHVVQNPTLVKQKRPVPGAAGHRDPGGPGARRRTREDPATAHSAVTLAAVEKPNVVIDHADNIERLMRIVAEIDVANEEEFVVRPLTYAWVGAVVAILEKVAPEQLGESGAGPQVVQVIAERNNSLILRGKSRPVAVIMDLVDKLDVTATSTDAAQVIRLSHAQAADIVGILNGLFTSQSGGEDQQHISIQADESLNAIVARADPGTMGEILNVLRMLDVRRTQVLIEAAIAEIAVDDLFTVGVEVAGTDQRGQSVPAFNTTLNGIVNALLAGAVPEGATSVDGVSLVGNATVPSVAVAKIDPDGISFGAVLNALATNVAADLLSAPSVLTLDNEEAKNLVGQNVPFRSGSFTTTADGISNPFSTVQRQDIGITLTVPHIHEGSSVRLEVLLTVENLVDSGLGSRALESADSEAGNRHHGAGRRRPDDRARRAHPGRHPRVPAQGTAARRPTGGRAAVPQHAGDARQEKPPGVRRPTVLHSETDVKLTTDRLYDRIREFRPEAATPPPDNLYEGRGASLTADQT